MEVACKNTMKSLKENDLIHKKLFLLVI